MIFFLFRLITQRLRVTFVLSHTFCALQVLLLENTRLHPGEESNDPALARQLASYGDVFVNDAFGACHRDQATVTGLTRHMRRFYPGLLVRKEVQYLTSKLRSPARCAHSSARQLKCVFTCNCARS
jgi:3-phosphoglycerate kinase